MEACLIGGSEAQSLSGAVMEPLGSVIPFFPGDRNGPQFLDTSLGMACRPTARSSCAPMRRLNVAASCSSVCRPTPGDEPRRMHLGLPQASRHAQLLRHGLHRHGPAHQEEPALDAATCHLRDRILEAGGAVLMSSRTYARLNITPHHAVCSSSRVW